MEEGHRCVYIPLSPYPVETHHFGGVLVVTIFTMSAHLHLGLSNGLTTIEGNYILDTMFHQCVACVFLDLYRGEYLRFSQGCF
jgi:hypothetical protein